MLSLQNVHKKFTKSVLENVTIEVNIGEIIGVAGENGSGKSTLLSIMAGLMKPDAGEVMIIDFKEIKNGNKNGIGNRNESKNGSKIGYVPQETALFDNLTVKDNIKFWAAAYNVPYLDSYANGLDLKKKVKHLSGGMKKRLSISLANLHEPDWLIMDEPTAALDIAFKGELAKMIEDAKTQNRSVIFTTHQPDELLWCDRIYILREGMFVYEGSPKDIGDLSGILYGRF